MWVVSVASWVVSRALGGRRRCVEEHLRTSHPVTTFGVYSLCRLSVRWSTFALAPR